MRQGGGNRDYMQNQGGPPMVPGMPTQQQMQAMTPEQAASMQQQMLAQQQQILPQVDTQRLMQMESTERRQEIGNTIYNVIQQ